MAFSLMFSRRPPVPLAVSPPLPPPRPRIMSMWPVCPKVKSAVLSAPRSNPASTCRMMAFQLSERENSGKAGITAFLQTLEYNNRASSLKI